ncbi:NAD(P)H-hydrate dehydratase [Shewanella fidelis]|uniref:Bifunctional NAD(P)H-hydrate repair enzyme n=1 Tax=Shewanella fidelis TaxID=173509 RepID=A0AAW8NI85_9GAMM|nr:NAD(P)H-hydrate dehydratase [Shewanella fidelis]MDR8522376.1 NAD(P)H-hydrate dehydratase [Shewanella fidelis]MDW4813090.1 NAD(P)H-hydrate dehydratase [Shewanella fidelis]MDW4816651.1 NAD(P)H-hydrate dehydratase [Shewanella fidelis]MDW4821097.1 NAD(P)H-hydrate dehydratase [Shewanella fidelis]MDW4825368.1 NAD(P)H-hydrate dehydratase [Shewanella fidelis]
MSECNPISTALYLSEQVRQAEVDAVANTKLSLFQLVEKAAQAAFTALHERLDGSTEVLVLAGRGNNGADAFVTAALLIEAGVDVQLQASESLTPSNELRLAIERFHQVGGVICEFNTAKITKARIIVDGLLGTGIRGELSAEYVQVIEAVNQSPAWVLSLDVPSGVDPDSGSYEAVAVEADLTLTFGGTKQGLLTGKARHCSPVIKFADIGLSEFLPAPSISQVTKDALKGAFKPRRRDAHKGCHGKVSIIGGDYGMAGAVRLAAEGCLRSGAGLVTVISRPEHQFIVSATRPELMFWGCELVDMEVYLKLGWASVLVIGPGLGSNDWGYNLLKAVDLTDKPCVIDADGLNQLKSMPMTGKDWVLTPHPGEAARLLDISITEVERDRYKAAKQLQQKYGGVVVLKGAGTIICDQHRCVVAAVGNPGLASGGCGDVLAGIIGGLMAQGFAHFEAAYLGVIIHGEAADIAAKEGERGMLASDLMPYIRQLVNQI